MKPIVRCAAFAALLLAAAPPTAAAAAQPIAGRWITAGKTAIVEIAPCGAHRCGTIVRLLGPSRGGADPRDANNPDAKLRTRRIVGLPILTGFVDKGEDWRGQIYDPNSGKTYRSVVKVGGDGTLDVKGCVGPFCSKQVWTRAK